MKVKYGNYLRDLKEVMKNLNDAENERRIQVLTSLLGCTPETHNFCCRIEILEAAENQIHYWKTSYGQSHQIV